VLPDPGEVDRRVRRVHDEEHLVLPLVDEEVVDRVAVRLAEQRVPDRPFRDLRAEVRRDPVDELHAVVARHAHAPHVREVEEPGLRAHGPDLVEDRAVLHRHVPAAELDHLRAERDVEIVEGSLFHEEGIGTRVLGSASLSGAIALQGRPGPGPGT
jgi:hypothetical protein